MLAHGASSLLSLKWCKAEQTVYVLCCCPHWPVGQRCHAEQFVLIFVVRVNLIGMNSLLFLSFFFVCFFGFFSTASNSNKSTPACSPVLRKRSRSPTPQSQEGENMVEKGSDHSSDKSPSTPEQVVQRTYSVQSARSGGKNSKVSTREIRLFIFSMHHLESDQMEIQYGLKHGALSLAYFLKNE